MLASETASDVSAPNHAIGEELRFKTDFYSYLDSPENASRYMIGIDALARMFPTGNIRVVDLGCGYASIAKYLPSRFLYTGVDHSSAAISECEERFPNFEFVQSDAIRYLNGGLPSSQPADVFVLCGFLFHNVDKDTLAKHDDQQLISSLR